MNNITHPTVITKKNTSQGKSSQKLWEEKISHALLVSISPMDLFNEIEHWPKTKSNSCRRRVTLYFLSAFLIHARYLDLST